ncbi:MAG: class I SAM-dependent methyltransferase [Labilithrix sp.]|nr:class I SAM-dependent methyltransferase [Labilithrix sp.]
MTTIGSEANAGGSAPGAEGAPTCGACGGQTRAEVARPASTYAPRGDYGIATCERCGSGRTVPVPQPDELEAFYAKEYKYDAHLLIAAEKRWRARRILDAALPAGAKRVLDVGCMYGYLLEEAKLRGVADAMGVELSAGAAKAAVAKGLDVFCGSIEAFAERGPGKFDLIVAQHVLEHVPEPTSFLKCARELLAPGGRVCLCVPNYDARARKVFREAWGWYQVPVHLHHFGARGLSSVLEDAGFTTDRAARRGGDSLFVLMTLLQSVGKMPSSSDAEAPSALVRALVRAASALLRPYYFVGDDELLVVASPR